jgi:diacylglycerol kinase (ATP)
VTQRVALVSNPTSGSGRAAGLVGPVTVALQRHGLQVDNLQGVDAEDAVARCRKAVADGVDALIALGGDGMVHLALQAVADTGTPLGIIPAGTGNDFAVALGLPIDAMAASDVVATGTVRTIDACRSGQRWWCNVLGVGFDSAVTERANAMSWPKGKRRYDLAILAELRTFRPLPFTLDLDGTRSTTSAMLIAIGNGSSYGGGMRITPGAVLDDGLLDITVVGPVSRTTLVRIFPRIYQGTHVEHPAVTVHRARHVTLACAGQVAYADGERFGDLPVTTEVVPGALQVLVPARASRARLPGP